MKHVRLVTLVFTLGLTVLITAGTSSAQRLTTPTPPATPAPSELLPKVTLSSDTVTMDLSKVTASLASPETLAIDIINSSFQSYSLRAADLYTLVAPLCHVATIAPSYAVFETCTSDPKTQIANWSKFFTALASIGKANASYILTTFTSTWRPILEPAGSTISCITGHPSFRSRSIATQGLCSGWLVCPRPSM